MISVVIPLYNKEEQIGKTLQTVLNQTFRDFEIVIVNDGSTDNSVAEVEKFSDPRIRLINQTNAGVSAARNRGIDEAKGEFIALLDADDEWKPEYLEMQMNLASKYPECDVFATNYVFRNNDGKITPTIIRNLPFDGEDGLLTNYFKVATTSHPPLWTSAVMARKTAFKSIGGFPLGIKSGEDLLTWAKLSCNFKIAFSKSPLATFIFDENIFTEDQKQRAVSNQDEVGKELIKLYSIYKSTDLKKYIGLWYKMRTRICLSKRNRKQALHECIKSMSYSINLKILVFFGMCFAPYSVINKLFNKFG